jgi:glutamine synthetase
MEEVRPIVFNGDNYSEEWHQEAERRGLLNLRTTADALDRMLDAKKPRLFAKYAVLSAHELESRFEIAAEQYVKTLSHRVRHARGAGADGGAPGRAPVPRRDPAVVDDGEDLDLDLSETKALAHEVNNLARDLRRATRELAAVRAGLPEAVGEAVRYACDTIRPAMAARPRRLRRAGGHPPGDLWALPTYREMLFSK